MSPRGWLEVRGIRLGSGQVGFVGFQRRLRGRSSNQESLRMISTQSDFSIQKVSITELGDIRKALNVRLL